MEPTSNDFTNQQEVFFIEFDGIMKEPNQRLMHLLLNDLYDNYKDYLHLEEYKGASIYQSLPIAFALNDINIIRELSKKDNINHDKLYKELKEWDPDLYKHCDELLFVQTVMRTVNRPFCKKIYFYTPTYDERVYNQIAEMFNCNPSILYCYGDYSEVFTHIDEKITTFVLAEYDSLYGIKDYEHIDYTDILLASYVRNGFFESETGKFIPYALNYESIFEGKVVRLNQFNPMIFRNEHLQGIVDPVIEELNKLYEEKQEDRGENPSDDVNQ